MKNEIKFSSLFGEDLLNIDRDWRVEELILQEAFFRASIDEMGCEGIDDTSLNKIEGMIGLLRNYCELAKELREFKKNK